MTWHKGPSSVDEGCMINCRHPPSAFALSLVDAWGDENRGGGTDRETGEAIITVIRGMGRDDQARQDESNTHVMSAMVDGCTLLIHP